MEVEGVQPTSMIARQAGQVIQAILDGDWSDEEELAVFVFGSKGPSDKERLLTLMEAAGIEARQLV